MLTTTDYFAFMNALDPGDLLIFGGTDPMDRLLQWIDGTSHNHAGVWLGDVADKDDPTFIEENLTIHAGLSARSLTDEEKLDLFGSDEDPGPARRHGTIWLIPLDVLLDPRGPSEVGGGLQFDIVTAVRWNRFESLDVKLLVHELMKKMNADNTAPVFDFGQLAKLAEYWIKRAYLEAGPNQGLSNITMSLFGDMKDTIEAQAQFITDSRPAAEAGKEPAEETTCSRYIYDGFKAAGYDLTIPIPNSVKNEIPTDAAEVRDWITPNDILRSPDFKVFAQWTRIPTRRIME
ncbi:MAG: hypothetical protein ACRBK7_30990 [Acidimicrobiales bacterium]